MLKTLPRNSSVSHTGPLRRPLRRFLRARKPAQQAGRGCGLGVARRGAGCWVKNAMFRMCLQGRINKDWVTDSVPLFLRPATVSRDRFKVSL